MNFGKRDWLRSRRLYGHKSEVYLCSVRQCRFLSMSVIKLMYIQFFFLQTAQTLCFDKQALKMQHHLRDT